MGDAQQKVIGLRAVLAEQNRELEELLLGIPGYVEKRTEFLLSPAAANAAKGESLFTLFTDILKDIASLGLDPSQVQQGVIFFSGQRGPGI